MMIDRQGVIRMNRIDDTIAAVCTAPGEAGVSVIRVSGPEALALADRVVICSGAVPSARAGGTFFHARVKFPSPHAGESIDGAELPEADEAVILVFRAPHSYTRQDVVEIQGHGGRMAAQRIMRALLAAGARQAAPGEFTCRAFLNGRIDLLQAEAVADLIGAQSNRAAGMALAQLEGVLSRQVGVVYDQILSATALLEVSLDFPEEDVPYNSCKEALERLVAPAAELEELLSTAQEGHILREGALVVIAGMPNVGKSTLLNSLLGRERAIISELPGTTRDTLEEALVLNGYPLRLVDTAGLRDADCMIEQEGVRRARLLLEQADLVLYVVDASQPYSEADKKLYAGISSRPHLVLLNKVDRGVCVQRELFAKASVIETCLLDSAQSGRIKAAVAEAVLPVMPQHSQVTIAERHRQILLAAVEKLKESIVLLESGDEAYIVPAADCLRLCLDNLGLMTGRTYHSELLENIFSGFCVGK